MQVLHIEEPKAIDDQSSGHHPGGHEVLIHPVVQGQAHHRRGDAGQHHLAPQVPSVPLLADRLAGRKWIEPMEKQQQYRQNSAQLNYIAVHIHKFCGDVELDELIHQNEVSRRADGQPLRNALHHA